MHYNYYHETIEIHWLACKLPIITATTGSRAKINKIKRQAPVMLPMEIWETLNNYERSNSMNVATIILNIIAKIYMIGELTCCSVL